MIAANNTVAIRSARALVECILLAIWFMGGEVSYSKDISMKIQLPINSIDSSPRAAILAWLLLALLALILCGRVLFSVDQIFGAPGTDMVQQFIAWRYFGFHELSAGQFPMWNPYIFAGAPYFGGFQAALAYPLNWPIFLLFETRTAINLSVVLHCTLMGTFTYHWLRNAKFSDEAAIMGAGFALLGGTYVTHIYAGHLPNLCAMVWFPLMLRAVDGASFQMALSRPSMRQYIPSILIGAAAVAMQILAGHPQYVFVSVIAVGIYAFFSAWGRSSLVRTVFLLIAMVGLGGAMAGVQLLSGIVASSESIRSRGVAESFAAMFSLPLENFWTLAIPNVLGSLTFRSYFGRWYFWEMCLYIGWGALLLALLGASGGRHAQYAEVTRYQRRALAVMSFSVLLISIGDSTPLHHFLYTMVPGFDRIRGVSKFAFVITLALAYWAAQGYDRLGRSTARPLAWCAAALSAFLFAIAFALQGVTGDKLLAWLVASKESYFLEDAKRHLTSEGFLLLQKELSLQSAVTFLWAGGELLIWAGLLVLVWCRPVLKPLIACIAVLQLLMWANGMVVSTSVEEQIAHWGGPASGASNEYRVANQSNKNSGMYTGAMDVSGNDPGVTVRYAELMAAIEGGNPDEASQYIDVTQPHPLHTLLRLQYVKPLAVNGGGQWLQVQDPPMPRFSLVDGFSVRRGRDAVLQRMLEPSFDPRKEVVLEQAVMPVPQSGAKGQVNVLACTSDACSIEVWLDKPALLLITDAWTPSWRIKSDKTVEIAQARYELHPGDYAFRVVALAAGEHRLTMYYSRKTLYAGAAISATALAVFLGLIVWCVWPLKERPKARTS
jgi:hypothetical protein